MSAPVDTASFEHPSKANYNAESHQRCHTPQIHVIFPTALSDDVTSTNSTNHTESDLPGPGRIVGNFYSKAGKTIEKRLGNLARKTGYGPKGTRYQIERLLEDCHINLAGMVVAWVLPLPAIEKYVLSLSPDEIKGRLVKSCKKLVIYTQSSTISIRIQAMKEIIYLCSLHPELREEFKRNDAKAILQSTRDRIESKSRTRTLSGDELEFFSIIDRVIPFVNGDIKARGDTLLSPMSEIPSTTEIQTWKDAFMSLLSYLSDPDHTRIALEYFDIWSRTLYQPDSLYFDLAFALKLCMTLSVVLSTNALFSASDKKKLKSVVSFLHLSLTSHLAFLQPYDQGWLSEETIICDGVCVHIPSVVDTLEVLRMHLESRNLDTAHWCHHTGTWRVLNALSRPLDVHGDDKVMEEP